VGNIFEMINQTNEAKRLQHQMVKSLAKAKLQFPVMQEGFEQ
jgi:hypothetical protein